MRVRIQRVALATAIALGLSVGVLAGPASARPSSTQSVPSVPANSVCRAYSRSGGGLATEDHRISVVLDDPEYPSQFTISSTSGPIVYLFARDGDFHEYGLGSLQNGKLVTIGPSFIALNVCITDPGPATPPFGSRYALVDQQYRDFFGRKATTAEQQSWAGSGKTGSQIVAWFVVNEEAQRGPLVRLYKAYYRRWPDPGGYSYWIGKMRSGTSLSKVSATFAAASEFKTKYGSLSNSAFVKLVYENVLERQPDPAGLNYWIGRLNAKKISRGALMVQFSESSEFKRKFGTQCDQVGVTLRMLRRAPTASELTSWSGLSAAALATQILNSGEYAERITP